jgi:hypothetical protein
MNSRLLPLLVVCLSVGILAGCVRTPDNRRRPAVPFVKDRIESRYERPMQQVFDAARDTLTFNGTLTSEDVVNHVLVARIDTRTVWVKVDEVEPKVTRVITVVRTKGGGGDVALAAELDKQIALRLR